MAERPRLYDRWELLRDVACELRDTRARIDPGLVERGRLTRPDADERRACATALATLWTHIAERTPLPVDDHPLGLEHAWSRIRRDLDAAIASAAARAGRSDADDIDRNFADALVALRWWMVPTPGLDPRILFIVEMNRELQARAAAGQRRAA